MECVSKHDFAKTADDELSFQRGDKIKILSMDEDKNWFKAELNGQMGYIPSNYIEMKAHTWYLGSVPRARAEAMLLEKNDLNAYIQKNGSFLVRNSESSPGEFSLSVKFEDTVQHFKVLRDGAGKYFLWVMKFNSLNALVDHHRTNSVSRSQTIYLTDMIRSSLEFPSLLEAGDGEGGGKGRKPMAQRHPKVIANYDFSPKDGEELMLKRGEIVMVMDKSDPNWWLGEVSRNNKPERGLFPRTYVSPYTDA